MTNPTRGAEQVAIELYGVFANEADGFVNTKETQTKATALISAAIDEAVGELPTILSGLVAAVDEFKRRANPAMSGKELAAFAAICHFTTRARAALNQEKEKKPSGQ